MARYAHRDCLRGLTVVVCVPCQLREGPMSQTDARLLIADHNQTAHDKTPSTFDYRLRRQAGREPRTGAGGTEKQW